MADHHIQYWNPEDHRPSPHDVFRTLRLCLALLADSLSLAIEGLKTASPEKQLDFWRAFMCLDKETDFASRDLPECGIENWVQALNDFYDVAGGFSSQTEPGVNDETAPDEIAAEIARRIARKMFEDCGNPSEMHISEKYLAAVIATTMDFIKCGEDVRSADFPAALKQQKPTA